MTGETPAARLLPDVHRTAAVDALADLLGGRVGLQGPLGDLNRRARETEVPGAAVTWGVAWDRRDAWSARWWPQGVTTSADHDPGGTFEGRDVVLTSAYAQPVRHVAKGARITVVDVTDPGRVRYRHVLLVEAVVDEDGRVDVRPVPVHAGGLLWHGPWLHVAATARGVHVFHLDDVVRVPGSTDPNVLGRQADGSFAGFGHRYLLPLRFRYRSRPAPGTEPVRFSFLSLDRGPARDRVLVGEYGRGSATTRLLGFDLHPATRLLASAPDDPAGAAVATPLGEGVEGMQGAVRVHETLYVVTSAGRRRGGSLWVGRPGALVEHRGVLPRGPEALCHHPGTDRLWSVTEHPGARWLVAMDRRALP